MEFISLNEAQRQLRSAAIRNGGKSTQKYVLTEGRALAALTMAKSPCNKTDVFPKGERRFDPLLKKTTYTQNFRLLFIQQEACSMLESELFYIKAPGD